MTSLARIIISVSDLERSLALYRDALGLRATSITHPIARLATSGTGPEVMLHERPTTPARAAVTASFGMDDVDEATRACAAAGASVVDEPADQPWGERQSVLRDPDGHLFCLVASTGAATGTP